MTSSSRGGGRAEGGGVRRSPPSCPWPFLHSPTPGPAHVEVQEWEGPGVCTGDPGQVPPGARWGGQSRRGCVSFLWVLHANQVDKKK